MSSFVTGLWESIFQPGTSPQLIAATHISFAALLATLGWLIAVTHGNIHFIMLFIIASLLWITVIWFIAELKSAKLLTNAELDKKAQEGDEKKDSEEKKDSDEKESADKAASTATPTPNAARSRKA
ncbi:Pkr1 protein [Maudiozyma humilis]|uniref:Pkr1 protein n=1 Tax=Maudiozyma humilis TaxID=51915 RepID=A0AAV5RVI9_MAUHU|nr:Pkr1 protein [Kazachstania humilis]